MLIDSGHAETGEYVVGLVEGVRSLMSFDWTWRLRRRRIGRRIDVRHLWTGRRVANRRE